MRVRIALGLPRREGGLHAEPSRWLSRLAAVSFLVVLSGVLLADRAAASPLSQAGSLVVAQSGNNEGLGSAAVSGPTMVAAGFGDMVGPNPFQQPGPGVVYVFTESPSGWGSETQAATLTASDGAPGELLGQSVAISGQTVFAGSAFASDGSASYPPPGAVYVFTEPVGGWSGSVHEVAKLTPSTAAGCSGLQVNAVSGRDVVAVCTKVGSDPPQAEVLIFTEPPGGWSGTLHETAKLAASSGDIGGPVAFMGRDLLTVGTDASRTRGAVYVYHEPTGGWSGTLKPSATLMASNGAGFLTAVVSGRTVFAGTVPDDLDRSGNASIYAFTEPAKGWSGTLHQTARLTYPGVQGANGPSIAAQGRLVAVSFWTTTGNHSCTCSAPVNVFSEPTAGWSGTIGPQASTTIDSAGDGVLLALQDKTLFATDGYAVHLFQVIVPPGLPAASHELLNGVGAGKPTLSFKLTAGANAPSIRSFTVGLPRGLSFHQNRSQLTSGIALFATQIGTHKINLSHGKLVVTLSNPADGLAVSIRSSALTESRSLVTRVNAVIAFNKRTKHGRKRSLTLNFPARLTDASGKVTELVLALNVG